MKKRLMSVLLAVLLCYTFVSIPKQAEASTAYMDTTNARYFLAFIYNSNVENFTAERLANDDYYKLLTGQLSGDGEYEYYTKVNFLLFINSRVEQTLSKTGNAVHASNDALIEYFTNQYHKEVLSSILGIFKKNVASSLYDLCGYDGNSVTSILGGMVSFFKNPTKYSEDVMAITNALIYSYGQNTESLYLYFDAALSWAGYDEEVYETAMSYNKMALQDGKFMSYASLLIPGLTHWTDWIDQLDYWAKYVYNMDKEVLKGPPVYTITYNSNCSDVSDYVYTYSKWEDNWYVPTMQRSGYIFQGWYWDSACTNSAEGTITIDRDLTFYAKWIQRYRTITFNSNCSDVANFSQQFDILEETWDLPEMERPGYIFEDWYWDSACTNEATSFSIYQDHTVYAKWEKIWFTITFDSNCSEVDDYSYTYDKTKNNWIEPEMERPGYIFQGWYWDKECNDIASGESVEVNENLTLYAKWTAQYSFEIKNNEVTITGLDYYAVVDGVKVTDIVLPETINGYKVTEIGESAFSGNSTITSIKIPDNVRTIGNNAFYGCSKLTNITVPDGVETVGDKTFCYCSNLKNITIGSGVKSIGENVFGSCSKLNNIEVKEENLYYCSQDGILYNKDKSSLIKYPCEKTEKSFVMPYSVIEVCDRAFYECENLETIVLSENTERIRSDAFCGCIGITDITIPDSVTYIGNGAFNWCDNLENVNIGKGVRNIDIESGRKKGVFVGSYKLKDITVDEENQYYCVVDGILFNKDKTILLKYANAKLDEQYFVPEGVQTIVDYAFEEGNNLHTITVPKSVTYIGYLEMDYWLNNYGQDTIGILFYEGSESDWNNVSFKEGNDIVVFKNLKYASELTKITYDGEETYGLIDFVGEFYKKGNHICAFYKDGRLVKIEHASSENPGLEFWSDIDHDEIKVMVWDDLTSGTPLREVECISTADWTA